MPQDDIVEDGIFIFAPSYVLWERGELTEGKSIGTAKHTDLALAKHIIKGHKPGKNFSKEVKQGATVGRKKLAEVELRTLRKLSGLIVNVSKLSEDDFRERAIAVMKSAWRDTFLAGIRAAGTPGYEVGKGKLLIPGVVSSVDEAWLNSAMSHEMQFFNVFLDEVVAGTSKLPVLRRAKMYVDALESFYNSARVIGLPNDVVLHWVGPEDKAKCPGCAYLAEHSPFSKFNLPTVPCAGMTPCLTNCRDRILVRKATPEEVKALTEGHKYTRASHINNLRRIKRTGKL